VPVRFVPEPALDAVTVQVAPVATNVPVVVSERFPIPANVPVKFVIEPYIRFRGEPGEQATLFFLDPSGNALEFKAFRNIDAQLFAT